MEPVKQINSWRPVKQINSWHLQSSLRIKPFRSKIVTITAKITNRAEVLCASDGCGNLATAPCRESYPVSGMHNRAKLIVTLSASGFAGDEAEDRGDHSAPAFSFRDTFRRAEGGEGDRRLRRGDQVSTLEQGLERAAERAARERKALRRDRGEQ